MSDELPVGWTACRVSDFFHSFGGGTPNRSAKNYWGGSIPWLSSGDIKSERIQKASETITKAGLQNSASRSCPPGSVLVVVRSGILKHTLPVAILDRPAAINQDIKCFDSGHAGLNEWLALSLRASAREILALNREGTTVQSVKYETLRDFEIRVPPFAEQRRIVRKLDLVLAGVDKCRQRLTKASSLLARFRQSVLAAACSGRLTADWRSEHTKSDDDSGTDLPAGWKSVTVDEVTDSLKYGTSKKCDYARRGVAVLRIPNIAEGGIDTSDLKYAKLPRGEFKQLRLRRDDLLLIRSNGSVSLVGKCALVGTQGEGMAYAGYLIRLRCKKKLVRPDFLNQVLGSFGVRLQIELEARSTSGVNNINSDEVRALRFALPPIREQAEIVRRLKRLTKVADRLEARMTTSKSQVDLLTSAILARAFRGELVVTEAELAREAARNFQSASSFLEAVKRKQQAEKDPQKGRKRGRSATAKIRA